MHAMDKMDHAYYEEKDRERSFFMVEAFRWGVWPTRCLLATSLTYTNKEMYILLQ